MFDLEHEIASWRRAMVTGGVNDPAVLDELESHLRDHIEQQVRSGREVGQAFRVGVERIGRPAMLKQEFLRAQKMPGLGRLAAFWGDSKRCRWLALGLAAFVAAAYYVWHARITPVYAGVAVVEFQGLREMSRASSVPLERMRAVMQREFPGKPVLMDGQIAAAEHFNNCVRMLTSKHMQARVLNSFSWEEQSILVRAALKRQFRGQPALTVDDMLGQLAVRAQRLSFVVTVSVMHRDPEAAALIANRYVELWRSLLAAVVKYPLPQIEVATPSREPVPNLKLILWRSIGLGIVTFMGFTAAATIFRKLLHLRIDAGPQVKTS